MVHLRRHRVERLDCLAAFTDLRDAGRRGYLRRGLHLCGDLLGARAELPGGARRGHRHRQGVGRYRLQRRLDDLHELRQPGGGQWGEPRAPLLARGEQHRAAHTGPRTADAGPGGRLHGSPEGAPLPTVLPALEAAAAPGRDHARARRRDRAGLDAEGQRALGAGGHAHRLDGHRHLLPGIPAPDKRRPRGPGRAAHGVRRRGHGHTRPSQQQRQRQRSCGARRRPGLPRGALARELPTRVVLVRRCPGPGARALAVRATGHSGAAGGLAAGPRRARAAGWRQRSQPEHGQSPGAPQGQPRDRAGPGPGAVRLRAEPGQHLWRDVLGRRGAVAHCSPVVPRGGAGVHGRRPPAALDCGSPYRATCSRAGWLGVRFDVPDHDGHRRRAVWHRICCHELHGV
mmetsp:Transcript_129560/g.360988  ORF Transcript_129560/g.360988 Transcript_129560/m.360988 type:complete len:400 (+) Transcript_129560:339-1538(+)